MPKGYRTLDDKRQQAIALAQTSMTQQAIADKVGISRRQVKRIWDNAGISRRSEDTVRRGVTKRLATEAPSVRSALSDVRIQRHYDALLVVLNDLQGIDVFPLRSPDIQTWLDRPEEPSWPVAKGRVWREKNGCFRVSLDAEDKLEWQYLQQHLAGDPVWKAVEDWKLAMAKDMAARAMLMDAIATRIKAPREQEGLGLPIGLDLGFIAVTRSEVTSYFLFTIYDQVLSWALGLRHSPKRREEFDYRDPGYPEVVSLGGIPVVRSTDPEVRSRAVSFLLEAQESLGAPLEVRAAVAACHEAKARTSEVKHHLRRILLALGLPPGSVCDGCRAWFSASPV